MKIVLMEPLGISQETLSALSEKLTAEGHTFTAYDTVTTDTQELIERAGDAEVLIIANHPLPGDGIRADENLKMISVAFVGIDHVDVEACKEKGVLISNTGGYCNDAVAELAVGLTLDCLKYYCGGTASVQAGRQSGTAGPRAGRQDRGHRGNRCHRLQNGGNLQSIRMQADRLQPQ